jgi:hypothetical protein
MPQRPLAGPATRPIVAQRLVPTEVAALLRRVELAEHLQQQTPRLRGRTSGRRAGSRGRGARHNSGRDFHVILGEY